MTTDVDHKRDTNIIEQVDSITEEVKALALNLAIYLAKAKAGSEKLSRLEPNFIRLINGTVNVVQEISHIVEAARKLEPLVLDPPSGRPGRDHIEAKLRSILDQCNQIMSTLSQSKDYRA
ncbi:MAG: hypothetical protein U9R56_03205 [candidate division Zixibacteria bacterium]|nr:hypothetical protein [candidate division Zixibacteria bacterium]